MLHWKQYLIRLPLCLGIIDIINLRSTQLVESFSNHRFNRTSVLFQSIDLDTTKILSTSRTKLRILSMNSLQLEKHFHKQMETIRNNLLETIPVQLINAASGNETSTHSDSDLDKAVDFVETHAKNKDWKHNLAKFIVLKESNFKQLASAKQITRLLEDYGLLEEMILADGPSDGNWPKAMEIYDEILEVSDAVHDDDYPILHRLAVAIAVVHATAVVQTNPVQAAEDVSTHVDPVRRYLNYELAFLEGELDPDFDSLSVWELRFVVDGDESDEIAVWGRKTLRNYYPEHAMKSNTNREWMYAALVRSDVPYGSSRVGNDDPKLHKYQNILRNGGICGRRAFFGRFILRAFGIPTTARPSKGHAALVHWSGPKRDWVVNLGGGWGKGWTKTNYVKDLDFLATTKARKHENYVSVKLAQCLGEVFGEKPIYGIYDEREKGRDQGVLLNLQQKEVVGFWYRLSLQIQSSNLKNLKPHNYIVSARSRAATIHPNIIQEARKTCFSGDRKQVTHNQRKVMISIPAASFANPQKTKDVKVMMGFGDEQIYLPSFQPQGTTILRGGSWKDDHTWQCTSGGRLLSGGYGRYENWGFRVAMTYDDEEMSCPEPNLTVSLQNGDTMDFVYVPPGKFVMGGTSTKDGRFNCVEVPHHAVKISKGFYLGKYPVTQAEFQAVMNGKNPSKSSKGPQYPVDNINIEDATAFCRNASELIGTDIRLPTEAEWEYAARGTTNSDSADVQWFFGNDPSKLVQYAWTRPNADGKSHPVGLKKSNPFGLYDMYGNVCERVSDTYKKEYYAENKNQGVVMDPTGPSQGIKSKFQYNVQNIPQAGKYSLVARVCTVTVQQRLNVSLKPDGNDAVVMELPYTSGDWEDSEPIILTLKQGKNTLFFWRDTPPQYGVSVKKFTLTKVN